jgi:YD repeat-containing protein
LSKTVFEDGKTEHRNPDKTGNLFERLDRKDRKYERGGQLLKTENWEYKYDKEGNLIRKKDKHGAKWRYEWNDAGMLVKVKRPDAREIFFKYDALGRRIEKQFGNVFTRWV